VGLRPPEERDAQERALRLGAARPLVLWAAAAAEPAASRAAGGAAATHHRPGDAAGTVRAAAAAWDTAQGQASGQGGSQEADQPHADDDGAVRPDGAQLPGRAAGWHRWPACSGQDIHGTADGLAQRAARVRGQRGQWAHGRGESDWKVSGPSGHQKRNGCGHTGPRAPSIHPQSAASTRRVRSEVGRGTGARCCTWWC